MERNWRESKWDYNGGRREEKENGKIEGYMNLCMVCSFHIKLGIQNQRKRKICLTRKLLTSLCVALDSLTLQQIDLGYGATWFNVMNMSLNINMDFFPTKKSATSLLNKSVTWNIKIISYLWLEHKIEAGKTSCFIMSSYILKVDFGFPVECEKSKWNTDLCGYTSLPQTVPQGLIYGQPTMTVYNCGLIWRRGQKRY